MNPRNFNHSLQLRKEIQVARTRDAAQMTPAAVRMGTGLRENKLFNIAQMTPAAVRMGTRVDGHFGIGSSLLK